MIRARKALARTAAVALLGAAQAGCGHWVRPPGATKSDIARDVRECGLKARAVRQSRSVYGEYEKNDPLNFYLSSQADIACMKGRGWRWERFGAKKRPAQAQGEPARAASPESLQAEPSSSPSPAPSARPGQQADEVRRGNIDQVIRVVGTVVTKNVFRLKSTIEGRSEKVWTTTGTWVTPEEDLGFLINKEFAALTDSHGSTEKDVMQDRWKPMYQPSRIRCPADCYLLKIFLRSKQWVKPQAILIEAAAILRMVGRVRPEDAHLVRDGQMLQYWAVKNREERFQNRISNYVLDIQGNKVDPGGSFTMDMTPTQYFPPGTDWEGVIVPSSKKNVLTVPTGALISYQGSVYLPVKVSTGITTEALTEITAGVDAKRGILVIDDSWLKDNAAKRHKTETDFEALRRRLNSESTPYSGNPDVVPSGSRSGRLSEIRDPDAYLGEDPYTE